MLGEVGRGDLRTGLEHGDLHAGFGQLLGGDSSGGSGAHDNGVVYVITTLNDLQHSPFSLAFQGSRRNRCGGGRRLSSTWPVSVWQCSLPLRRPVDVGLTGHRRRSAGACLCESSKGSPEPCPTGRRPPMTCARIRTGHAKLRALASGCLSCCSVVLRLLAQESGPRAEPQSEKPTSKSTSTSSTFPSR